MIPKKERLSTLDFSKLKSLKFKKLITTYGFFVIYDFQTQFPKKGIVISKKNFKRAVDRNKIKRLFYNSILEMKKVNNEENNKLTDKTYVLHPKKIFTKEELINDLNKI